MGTMNIISFDCGATRRHTATAKSETESTSSSTHKGNGSDQWTYVVPIHSSRRNPRRPFHAFNTRHRGLVRAGFDASEGHERLQRGYPSRNDYCVQASPFFCTTYSAHKSQCNRPTYYIIIENKRTSFQSLPQRDHLLRIREIRPEPQYPLLPSFQSLNNLHRSTLLTYPHSLLFPPARDTYSRTSTRVEQSYSASDPARASDDEDAFGVRRDQFRSWLI